MALAHLAYHLHGLPEGISYTSGDVNTDGQPEAKGEDADADEEIAGAAIGCDRLFVTGGVLLVLKLDHFLGDTDDLDVPRFRFLDKQGACLGYLVRLDQLCKLVVYRLVSHNGSLQIRYQCLALLCLFQLFKGPEGLSVTLPCACQYLPRLVHGRGALREHKTLRTVDDAVYVACHVVGVLHLCIVDHYDRFQLAAHFLHTAGSRHSQNHEKHHQDPETEP